MELVIMVKFRIQTLLKPWRASTTNVEYRENDKSMIWSKETAFVSQSSKQNQ
jgi:hypothetical protein